jgi:hypothetical protein
MKFITCLNSLIDGATIISLLGNRIKLSLSTDSKSICSIKEISAFCHVECSEAGVGIEVEISDLSEEINLEIEVRLKKEFENIRFPLCQSSCRLLQFLDRAAVRPHDTSFSRAKRSNS